MVIKLVIDWLGRRQMKNNFCQGASCMCCCSCLASLSRNISLSDETSMLVEKKNRKGQVDMVGFSTYTPFCISVPIEKEFDEISNQIPNIIKPDRCSTKNKIYWINSVFQKYVFGNDPLSCIVSGKNCFNSLLQLNALTLVLQAKHYVIETYFQHC